MFFRSLHFWHRYLGLASALFIIVLAVTGVLVQHADSLQLNQRYLANQLLNRIYGIQPDPVLSYKANEYWVSLCGETLFLDRQPIRGRHSDLHGAAKITGGFAVATEDALLLLTQNGEVLDTLTTSNGLPERILGLAIPDHTDSLVVRGVSTYWQADEELIEWQKYRGPHPVWATPENAPEALQTDIQQFSLSREINWERLLLDLHSGRLFGKYGIYFMDIAAIAMLLLAMSGVWLWLQRRV